MDLTEHDWFLRDWLAALNKRQKDVVHDLGWNKAKISLMLSGQQPYTRKEVNQLASYLDLKPYELLMHPDEAMGIRKLRESAVQIARTFEEVSTR